MGKTFFIFPKPSFDFGHLVRVLVDILTFPQQRHGHGFQSIIVKTVKGCSESRRPIYDDPAVDVRPEHPLAHLEYPGKAPGPADGKGQAAGSVLFFEEHEIETDHMPADDDIRIQGVHYGQERR